MKRADRRAARTRLISRWLRRIRARWRRKFPSGSLALQDDEIILAAVTRVETHRDIRTHSRKTCSYCNPWFRQRTREKILDQDLKQELANLDVNLHDLLRPTPD